jgi:3-phenylpropionate/trans-cinnamate dioxygenase ferredoxin reductase component
MTKVDALIVGSGHGGAQAAIALRQQGFAGSIMMVGDEPYLPYERPPLSKEYLSGEKTFERLLIRPETFWEQRDIRILTGKRVAAVDPGERKARCSDGVVIGYDILIWATGGAPRRLPCEVAGMEGVHAVRTRADVDALLAELPTARKIVVVGGGYIGLEAAAVLTKFGKSVTVVEAVDRVLARVAGEPLSRFYEAEHRAHGVEIRLNTTVAALHEKAGRVDAVELADGTLLPADLVIVGIGVVPEIEPLQTAGAECGNGVYVDDHCRTSLPSIYAIGDCAAHENRFAAGARIRVESVQNANDQAIVVAKHVAGTPTPYDAVPWFWSNQYDLRLQTVGISNGHDEIVTRSFGPRSFSLVYKRDGKVIALDCVNATRDYVQGKALVLASALVPSDSLSNPELALKDIAAAAAP